MAVSYTHLDVYKRQIYPIAEIAEILDKGSTTIKGALKELDTAGLLERERGEMCIRDRYPTIQPTL